MFLFICSYRFSLIFLVYSFAAEIKWRQNTQNQRIEITVDCFSIRQTIASSEGRTGRSEVVTVLCCRLGLYDMTMRWSVDCHFYFLQLVKSRDGRLCAVFGKVWLGKGSRWSTHLYFLCHSLHPPFYAFDVIVWRRNFFMYSCVRCRNPLHIVRFCCEMQVRWGTVYGTVCHK
jgi:hypothetical protein